MNRVMSVGGGEGGQHQLLSIIYRIAFVPRKLLERTPCIYKPSISSSIIISCMLGMWEEGEDNPLILHLSCEEEMPLNNLMLLKLVTQQNVDWIVASRGRHFESQLPRNFGAFDEFIRSFIGSVIPIQSRALACCLVRWLAGRWMDD